MPNMISAHAEYGREIQLAAWHNAVPAAIRIGLAKDPCLPDSDNHPRRRVLPCGTTLHHFRAHRRTGQWLVLILVRNRYLQDFDPIRSFARDAILPFVQLARFRVN